MAGKRTRKRHPRAQQRPRQRPQRRQPRTAPPAGPSQPRTPEDQELFRVLRRALRSSEPLDLLVDVSGLLTVTDPLTRDPFAAEDDRPDLADLVDSFIGLPYAETTAALTVMQALVPDEVLAARIGRELSTRRHPMPDWLGGLGQAEISDPVFQMTDVLGDGDDYIIGVRLPSGHQLSVVVYVDHNLGTLVKDAFPVSEPLDDLIARVGSLTHDTDQSIEPCDPATARAVVAEAIHLGSRTYPPLESDTWPMCRPLVEWMVRMLPEGGSAPERPEWSEADQDALAEDFFASPYAAGLDQPDEHDLLGSVLWFGTDYGPGDPLRWSPVNVEMLLSDWFPRKVVAETAFLAKLPALLRAFIRYCHARRGLRAELTEDTLDAVDAWEPEYQRLIRSDRPQGPAALLAKMLSGAGEHGFSIGDLMLDGLDRAVGGRFVLTNLDDDPLPDEPFEWAGVPEDVRPMVQEMLDRCDRCADELLDVEHRTAMRRFLGRAAVGDPAAFRRRASPARGAAAVAWVICRANATVGGPGSKIAVRDLLAWFGVKGSVSQRAERLLRANGVDRHGLGPVLHLGAADLLTGPRRREIIETRDRYLTVEADE